MSEVGASQFNFTWCDVPVPVRLTVIVGFEDELLVIVSWPVAAPAVVGSNCRSRFTDCPALRVNGNFSPDTEKPVPVMVTALTVTLTEPEAVNFSDCDVGLFRAVLPKAMLVAFTDSVAAPPVSLSETVFDALPVVAVSVTVCAVLTEATSAVKVALEAVAGTVTDPGTVTAELLLFRATLMPPEGADPDRFTVHESASSPVIEVLPHEIALTAGVAVVPVPLRETVAVDAELAIVNCPVAELAALGA